MSYPQRKRQSGVAWAAYLEGEVTTSGAARMEAELDRSPEARACLSQLRTIRALLQTSERELEGTDLTAALRTAIAAQPPMAAAPKPTRRGWMWWSACAAVVVLGLMTQRLLEPRSPKSHAEFIAKSAVQGGHHPRQAAVQVYRVRDGAAPEPLALQIAARDGLLFSYVNDGAAAFRYLMVFAVDATGQIRWFHPAYLQEGTDPTSIAVSVQSTPHLIADVIEHDFPLGPLTLYTLFSHRPLRVSTVEAWLSRDPAAAFRPAPLPLAGGTLQRSEFTVVP